MNSPTLPARLLALHSRLDAKLGAGFIDDVTREEMAALIEAAAALSGREAVAFHRIRVVDWNEIAQEMPLGDDPYANGYHDAMNAVTRRRQRPPPPPRRLRRTRAAAGGDCGGGGSEGASCGRYVRAWRFRELLDHRRQLQPAAEIRCARRRIRPAPTAGGRARRGRMTQATVVPSFLMARVIAAYEFALMRRKVRSEPIKTLDQLRTTTRAQGWS